MRINKQKLAALMMSAVMAASTMSTMAFAEEETVDATAVVEEAVAEVKEAGEGSWSLVPDSASISDAGVVTWQEINSDGVTTRDLKAQASAEEHDATCTQHAYVLYTYTLYGENLSKKVILDTALASHTWGTATWVVVTEPTCKQEGVKKQVQICSACKAENVLQTVNTGLKDHTYEVTETEYISLENIKTDTKGEVVLEDGEPVLDDKTQSGSYQIKEYLKCTICGNEDTKTSDTIEIPAETGNVDGKRVSSDTSTLKNIYGYISDDGSVVALSTIDVDKIVEERIILNDCSQSGEYWVEYTQSGEDDAIVVNSAPVTVKAHHATKVEIEGKTDADKKLLVVTKDANGNTIVKTSSCVKTADYLEKEVCQSTTCSIKDKVVSTTEKVAQPGAKHSASSGAKAVVAVLQTSATNNNGVASQIDYETFIEAADGENSGVEYETTATCDKEGVVTIKYLCSECGKETGDDPITVKVAALNHAKTAQRMDNVVEATCSKDGSYDLVTYCVYCDKTMQTLKVTQKKLAHSFVSEGDENAYITFIGNVIVDYDGSLLDVDGEETVNSYDTTWYGKAFGVYAQLVRKCSKCGETEVYSEVDNASDMPMKILDIKKESNGVAGSITLEATYERSKNGTSTETITVPYYSNMVAYLERNPETVINGLHHDPDGIWRYYENNEFQPKFFGIVEYDGGEFFVANGVLCRDAAGLCSYGGKWYFLANGKIQRGYTGLVKYDGEWFYITNGELDKTMKGLVPYDGSSFLVASGRIVREYSGLWQDSDGTWYFLARGQVQTFYTGVAVYDGHKFQLEDGKLIKMIA